MGQSFTEAIIPKALTGAVPVKSYLDQVFFDFGFTRIVRPNTIEGDFKGYLAPVTNLPTAWSRVEDTALIDSKSEQTIFSGIFVY